jgi:hypothetical protein
LRGGYACNTEKLELAALLTFQPYKKTSVFEGEKGKKWALGPGNMGILGNLGGSHLTFTRGVC